MKTKDPIIELLTTLRDAAPSISLLDLFEKSPKAEKLSRFARMMKTPKVSFKQGKCNYTVFNTWEHFDYLIRQHARLRQANYASYNLESYNYHRDTVFDSAHEIIKHHANSTSKKTVKSPNLPRFRTRRSAEGGFTAQKKKAKHIQLGTVLFTSNTLQQLAICSQIDDKQFTLTYLSTQSRDRSLYHGARK